MPAQRTAALRGIHSVAYGQACVHCFKAKSRCVLRPNAEGCERCHRLKKPCESSESMRKRTRTRASPSGERVAQIEEKLDSLVVLLQSVAKSPSSIQTLHSALTEDIDPGRRRQPDHEQDHQQPVQHGQFSFDTPVSLPSQTEVDTAESLADEPGRDTEPTFENMSDEAAGHALDVFRSRFLPFTPFIWFPPNLTVRELRRRRPFLLRCIVAATTAAMPQKVAQTQAIKEIVAQELLVRNRSTMDFLQGLLVYINWGLDIMVSHTAAVSRLAVMAGSLVSDLRLNKPLPPDYHMVHGYMDCDEKVFMSDELDEGADHVLEQQRAVLGCFLVMSAASIYFCQTDGMRWTPKMDESLQALQARTTCSSDQALAFQVRLHLVLHRAIEAREQAARYRPGQAAQLPSLPPYLTRTLLAQLQEVKATMPAALEFEPIYTAHAHYVELSLNEMTFSANYSPADEAAAQAELPSNADYDVSIERTECYWRSIHASESLWRTILSMPPALLVGTSLPVWTHMSRAFMTLARLTTLQLPQASAWDCKAVRSTINLLSLVDGLLEKLKDIIALSSSTVRDGDHIIGQIAHVVQATRRVLVKQQVQEDAGAGEGAGAGASSGSDGFILSTPMWNTDSAFWQTTSGWEMWLDNMFSTGS